jgi:hypothetical protein
MERAKALHFFSLTFSKPKLGSNVVGGVTRQVINHLLHEMQILTSNSSGDPAPPKASPNIEHGGSFYEVSSGFSLSLRSN